MGEGEEEWEEWLPALGHRGAEVVEQVVGMLFGSESMMLEY